MYGTILDGLRQEHNNGEEYTTTAADHSGDFILWERGVKAGQVLATRLTMEPKNTGLKPFKIKRFQSCITQPCSNIPDGLPPCPAGDQTNAAVLGLLNATVAPQVDGQEMQNNILIKQLNHMIEKDVSTKSRVKNLHESSIKMLLFASAMDNKSVPIDLTESCKLFINSQTVALAKQVLNFQFKNRGMTEVSFLMGYTANMYLGALLWSSGDTPSNHSPFSFTKSEPLRMEEHKIRHLMLQLILTQGKGMTVDEIKASNKQEEHTPMNFHNMAEQLKMFM